MMRLKLFAALLALTQILCYSCESANSAPSSSNPNNSFSHLTPTSKYITVEGSIYTTTSQDVMYLNRHSPQFVSDNAASLSAASANTTSGISINITTDSPTLVFHFDEQPGTNQFSPHYYSIYKNGTFVEKREMRDFGNFIIKGERERTHWQVYMPIHTGLVFKGIDVAQDSELWSTPTDNRAVYLAIGDSITHGIGHREYSSDETYPAILARGLDYQLYNVAISGSRIEPNIALYYDDLNIDIITVLWGYNDWNNSIYTIDELGDRYCQLLINLSQRHPEATIYAILPTYTTSIEPKYREDKTIGIDQLRDAENEAVTKAISDGCANIKMLDGNTLTSQEDLADAVHLNHDGAKRFATKLLGEISDDTTEGGWK